MKYMVRYFLVLIMIPVILSCYREPDISDTPFIEFENLQFIPGSSFDSLVLSFYFEDGDGNVGLFSTETLPPHHPFDYVVDADDSLVTLSSNSTPPFRLVTPGTFDEKFLSDTDSRTPYNCEDYAILDVGTGEPDTFFIKKNEFHYNLHLNFFRKVNGVYQEIDLESVFGTTSCGITYDGRIPVFDEETVESQRPVRGTITYPITSSGFPFIFGNDEFKIEFYIYDYDLNRSNVTSTPDLTLLGITR